MSERNGIWHSGRETISYRKANIECQFGCYYSPDNRSWTVYVSNECTDRGNRRLLSIVELAPIEEEIRQFLAPRRFFGLRLGTHEVNFIHAQSVA